MGGKLGVTPRFGKAAEPSITELKRPESSSPDGAKPNPGQVQIGIAPGFRFAPSGLLSKDVASPGSKKPGPIARAFLKGMLESVRRPACRIWTPRP
jgi:hypothetical protein